MHWRKHHSNAFCVVLLFGVRCSAVAWVSICVSSQMRELATQLHDSGLTWCMHVVGICCWYLNVIFRLSQIFPFTPVGHRVQKEVGRAGYQTGPGGQGRQHRHRGHSLGDAFSSKLLNKFSSACSHKKKTSLWFLQWAVSGPESN